jgi:hypothetical protein
MEKPRPDRPVVATKASEVAKRLDARLRELHDVSGPLPVAALFLPMVNEDRQRTASDWDSATQFYLALAAHHHAWRDMHDPRNPRSLVLKSALDRTAKRLHFPSGFDSPRSWEPESIRARLKTYQQLGDQ